MRVSLGDVPVLYATPMMSEPSTVSDPLWQVGRGTGQDLWASIRNRFLDTHAGGSVEVTVYAAPLVWEVGKTPPPVTLEPNVPVWATLDAAAAPVEVFLVDNGLAGWQEVGNTVFIACSSGRDRWPGWEVDVDHLITRAANSLPLGAGEHHFRFENTGSKPATLSFKVVASDGGLEPTNSSVAPDDSGYDLGGSDALAIIVAVVVCIVVFGVLASQVFPAHEGRLAVR